MKDIVNLQWSWLASSGDFDAVVTDTSARLVPKPSHPSAFVLKSLPCPNPIFICSCPKTPEMVLNLDRFCLCLELSYSAERVESSFHDENTQIQIVAGGTCTCTEDTDRESGCTGSGTRIETLEYWWNHIFLTVWVWLLLSQLVALKEMPTHQKKPTKGTYSRKVIDKGVWGQHDLVFEQPWLSTISWGTTTDQQRYPEIHEISW